MLGYILFTLSIPGILRVTDAIGTCSLMIFS